MTSSKLTSAQIYGLIEVARLHVGPAATGFDGATARGRPADTGDVAGVVNTRDF